MNVVYQFISFFAYRQNIYVCDIKFADSTFKI